MQVTCNQMGEAAGVGAALALKAGNRVGDVDAGLLRRALADLGVIII